MAFCERSNGPRNTYTKFHQDISIFTQVIACTGGQTVNRAVIRNSTRLVILINLMFITLYLSRLVKQLLAEQNYHILWRHVISVQNSTLIV